MKKRLTFFLLILFYSSLLYGQKHDYFWIFGYEGGTQSPFDDEFGNAVLDFNYLNRNGPELTVRQEYDMNFRATCATVCDSAGNLLFYSNGEKIYNAQHGLMENGDNINYDDGYGYKMPQGAMIIPFPGNPKRYILLHMDVVVWSGYATGKDLSVSLIDFSGNNDSGEVIVKDSILIADTLNAGQITAVKHANGRDWWVLIPENDSRFLYEILISPQGVLKFDTLGGDFSTVYGGLGQSAFSPDGTKFIRSNSVTFGEPFRLDIYDFDRCTGQLSNQRSKFFDYAGFGVGAVVSPDSRYLYILRTTFAFQFDLHAADIFATETLVAEWDGFISGAIYGSYFRFSQAGPDGRIYVASSPTFHLHQINFPNRAGTACDFKQHSINLEVYNAYTMPNFPNYRLGPVDGSSCDTLGLDNRPLAGFRWEHEDSLELLRVTFTDLSAYEPTNWHWDFGDATVSSDTSPVHVFPAEGVYQVCLAVSNAHSADTVCREVKIGTTGTQDPASLPAIRVSPNPAADWVTLHRNSTNGEAPTVTIRNATGVTVAVTSFAPGQEQLRVDLRGRPDGLYFYTVTAGTERMHSGKIVLQH